MPRVDVVGGTPHANFTDAAEPGTVKIPAADMPRIAKALRNQQFRYFWAGNFLSNIGTWMQQVAQGWLVLQLTNSGYWLGVVSFAASAPMLVFALIGGVVADYVDNRRLLMITQSIMALSAAALAALTFTGVIRVEHIALLALLNGIAMSMTAPSYQALVPSLVPRKDLTNAIALNSAQFNMSRVLGPTLGGFAMAWFGPSGNFLLNALSYLAVIVALTRISFPEPRGTIDGSLREKLGEGFDYVFSRPIMKTLVLLVSFGGLLGVPYLSFVPLFAKNQLGLGERGLGGLMAFSGFGAFCGAITIAYLGRIRNRGRLVITSGVVFFTSIILFAFSTSLVLSCFVQFTAGYSMILMIATINTLLQHLSSDEMRGRTMSIYATAYLGLPPVGALMAGILSRQIGAPAAIAGMSLVALAGFIILYYTRQEFRYLD